VSIKHAVFLVLVLALSSYSIPANSKSSLLGELITELEKIPKADWKTKRFCGSCTPRITLTVNKVAIDIDEAGFVYINGNIIYPGFNKRLRKIYKKIIRFNVREIRLMKAIKALKSRRRK